MKTILSILLFVSLLGYLNHEFPDRVTKIYNDLTGNEPVPVQVVQTIPNNPPKVEMVQSVPKVIQTTPTPHPVIIPVVLVVTPVPSPEIHKPWLKPDVTNFPKSIVLIDGTKYENVKVLDVSPDAVSIMHRDGVSLIDIQNVPKNLQEQLNYDPYWSKQASDDRVKQEQSEDQGFLDHQNQLAINETNQDQINKTNEKNANDAFNQSIQKRIQDLTDSMNKHNDEAARQDHRYQNDQAGDSEREKAGRIYAEIQQLQGQFR